MSTFEVLEAYISLRREVALIRAAAASDLEFGHNQISVLYRLTLSNATMSELSEYALSDKASMSRTVALLEKAGLIRRNNDKNDRRITHIELTAAGRTQARKAQEIRQTIGKQLDAGLSVGERRQLTTLINKVVENLKARNSRS